MTAAPSMRPDRGCSGVRWSQPAHGPARRGRPGREPYVEERRTLPAGPARDAVLGDLAGRCRAPAAEPAPFPPDGAARLDGTDPAFPRVDGPGAPAILRR